MNFHENIAEAFQPLETYVLNKNVPYEKTMSQYMYMYHDDKDIHYYKHKDTRCYLCINVKGKRISGTLTII